MAKKHKCPEHVNHERWLVSYADFITLLFATFTALFAMSNADMERFREMAESLKLAFQQGPRASLISRPRVEVQGEGAASGDLNVSIFASPSTGPDLTADDGNEGAGEGDFGSGSGPEGGIDSQDGDGGWNNELPADVDQFDDEPAYGDVGQEIGLGNGGQDMGAGGGEAGAENAGGGSSGPEDGGATEPPTDRPDGEGGDFDDDGKGNGSGGEGAGDARIAAELQQMLDEVGLDGKVEVRQERRGTVISLSEAAFFGTGETYVLPECKWQLDKIINALRTHKYEIRIEGHTDNTPVTSGRYNSNLELSSLRAARVVEFMIEEYNFPPGSVSSAGYGEWKPIADNSTPEGRQKNRRVDIVILNQLGQRVEPGSLR